MYTEGHKNVAKTAGLPLLEEAFGEDPIHTAFYLGNWLTDISQLIDPVAVKLLLNSIVKKANKLNKFKQNISVVIKEILASCSIEGISVLENAFILEQEFKKTLGLAAKKEESMLHTAIDFLVEPKTQEWDSPFFILIRQGVLLAAYFKFVHPRFFNDPERLDFQTFIEVFGKITNTCQAASPNKEPANDESGKFGQYYPYQHYDRPPLSSKHSPYDKNKSASSKLKIYPYLQNDIEITAGMLADLDLEFEKVLYRNIKMKRSEWAIALAKLGHTIHQVEDFFAHSNWIELAMSTPFGKEALDKAIEAAIPEIVKGKTREHQKSHLYTIFNKRLKKFDPNYEKKSLRELQNEEQVVTGFFDFKDMLMSMMRLVFKFFEKKLSINESHVDLLEKKRKRAQSFNGLPSVKKIKILIRDTLEFLEFESEIDENNIVFQGLKKEGKSIALIKNKQDLEEYNHYIQKKAKDVALLVTQLEFTKDLFVKPEIKAAFINMIIAGSWIHTTAETAFSIFSLMDTISSFMLDPKALLWHIAFKLNFVNKSLEKLSVILDKLKVVWYITTQRIDELLFGTRIGSHSLIAKDGASLLYKEQKQCAIAVHWFIVNLLLRWTRQKQTGQDQDNMPFIDWYKLLTYFFHNPAASDDNKTMAMGTLIHITQKAQTASSVVSTYLSTAMSQCFDWKTILDANFNTSDLPVSEAKIMASRIIRETGMGSLTGSSEIILKPGVPLLIPHQAIPFKFFNNNTDGAYQAVWYEDVIQQGWEIIKEGLCNKKNNKDKENNEGNKQNDKKEDNQQSDRNVIGNKYYQPQKISIMQAHHLIKRGARLRQQARNQYTTLVTKPSLT